MPHLPRPLGPIVAYTPYSGMTDAEERVIWGVLDLLSGAPSPDGYTLATLVGIRKLDLGRGLTDSVIIIGSVCSLLSLVPCGWD